MQIQMDDLEIFKDSTQYVVKRKGQYFRLGTDEGKILSEIKSGKDIKQIALENDISEDQISAFIEQLTQIGILGELQREKKNLLYYRIKLLNPDKIFTWVVGKFRPNNKNKTILLSLFGLFCFAGFVAFCLNFNSIYTNIIKDFNIENIILLYVLTIMTVLFHEFGHGLVCKYYGGEVNEFGFLFICGSPALYCDVSGTRTFTDKKKIINTLLAGIAVQFFIASVAIFMTIMIPGVHRLLNTFILWNIFMIISNLIPITRLDGYWIISTLVNIPNLYDKSIKLALGKSDNVLFDEHEKEKSKFIKIYGFINLLIMLGMILSLLFGISQINFVSNSPVANILPILQATLGIAMIIYFVKMLFAIKKAS